MEVSYFIKPQHFWKNGFDYDCFFFSCQAVAETYFKIELQIEVKESEIKFDTVHVSFQVIFQARFYFWHIFEVLGKSMRSRALFTESEFFSSTFHAGKE